MESATWDGCLGLADPDEVCTQEAIAGFRVLIADGPREWVYHLDSAGTQIIQNAIASDTESQLATYFDSFIANAPDAEVVLQVHAHNFFDSSTNITTLTTDGKVYFEKWSRYPEEQIPRKALLQISLEEVAEFEEVLQQQKFSAFKRLAYYNEDPSFANDGVYQLSADGISVSVSARDESLPAQLQAILEAWVWW